ncbi:MAG: RagB/SusD family nutrient uptake outer membrane protein [Bacteroidales bacterium]|jgi:hypothetical protein|nr:RagB/SusD family nutrient uptake outer membrane protein [Bacteroidales bacterium]
MRNIYTLNKGLKALVLASVIALCSCNHYLDIVPDDGLATLESAFSLRSTAIKYLYTCYAFLPSSGHLDLDQGYATGDEFWAIYDRRESTGIWSGTLFNMARGFQTAAAPYGNDWAGIYEGIRCCNIMLENIGTVPDLEEWEKLQWIAEVKFLKAFYHFHLMRKWGPVPLIRENLDINASVEEVRVSRDPMEDCFAYLKQLLDEAIPDLPLKNPARDEWGRITRPIAAAMKAKILVYAASPLFNNNTEQATLKNHDGTPLFKTDKSDDEVRAAWDSAMVACRAAIEICKDGGIGLYKFNSRYALPDTLLLEMNLRGAITDKWNEGIIWTNVHTDLGANQNLQQAATPNLQWYEYPDMPSLYNNIQPPIKIAEMFYTEHGLPIENDVAWNGLDPYELRVGDNEHRWYLRKDYTTIQMNFDREPRFYAYMGFDGGQWFENHSYKNNLTPNDMLWVACRAGKDQQKKGYDWGPVTGYYLKKVVHFENYQNGVTSYSCTRYPWPEMRYTDLLLLYAEAINEAEGPNGPNREALFNSIDSVRIHAGIPRVKEAWDNYSNHPNYYDSYENMKKIIHRERLIELAFEGQRFWDLRRWKEAYQEYAKGIYGFKVTASKPEEYYQPTPLAEQKFSVKDYFWPIQTSIIEQNPNLVQNIGW